MNFEMDKNKTWGHLEVDSLTVTNLNSTCIILRVGFFNGLDVVYRI